MELIFFYVNQSRTKFIEKQGFNFSSRYKFSVEYDKGTYILKGFECENPLPQNFFDETGCITNVTAVVGENGSGKTTLLTKLLGYSGQVKDKDHAPEYDAFFAEEYEIDKAISIYWDGNDLVCYHNIDEFENDTELLKEASAGTAEDSLRLLKAALNSYPTLFGYFESGFMFRNMTSLSADGIQEQAARPLYYALMAAVLVLAAGIGLTVFICMSTDKIYNRRQAAAVLDVPVLGTIHLFHKKKQQKAILISDSLTSGQYGEEIDKLTTRIEHAMNKQNYKTLMVNSIRENEGKSTVAVNLALNLSRRGKKVMLVDADMRRPAVAKIFDASVEKEKSFSEFLEGNCSLKESMRRDSRYKYLRCIFQGEAIGEPDKLLEGANFKKFLKLVSDHMDYVILDTAPIGIVRDAELIASSVDAALLVIRQDWARSVEVNDVVDVLDDTGVSVLGGVLNMAVGDKSGVSSRNKRYGSYYYGYAEKNDA